MLSKVQLLSIICFLTLLFSVEALAQSVGSSAPSTEIAILKAQLDTTKQFQDSFFSMSQWALGSAIGVAFVIAAFSWFNNRLAYERDRDFLRQESQTLQNQIQTTVQQEVHQILLSLEASIEGKQSAIQEAVEKAIQSKISDLSTRLTSISNEVLELKCITVKRDAEASFKAQNFRWALYKYCELLDLYVKRRTDYYEASEILDEIQTILNSPSFNPDAEIVNSSVATLKRLPTQHHAFAEALITSLKSKLS